jgi:DNA-binding NarL/FixJ family response regulator
MEGKPLRVAVLEEQVLLRDVLTDLLQAEGFSVTTSSADPQRFMEEVVASPPELALLELPTPTESGAEPAQFVHTLRVACPAVKVVVLSASPSVAQVLRAYKEGADGYLFKRTADRKTVLSALRSVASGERVYPEELNAELGAGGEARVHGDQLAGLTPRQRQVLACVGVGYDNQTIARLLNITERTVKSHMAALYKQYRTSSRVQLVLLAQKLGLDQPTRVGANHAAPHLTQPAS